MNFHYELRKSSCRGPLKILTQWTLRVLEVRRHELVIGRSPTWAPCHIRYYPAVGRIYIHGPAGQYIGWTHWPPRSSCLPTPIQAKYCPETGF